MPAFSHEVDDGVTIMTIVFHTKTKGAAMTSREKREVHEIVRDWRDALRLIRKAESALLAELVSVRDRLEVILELPRNAVIDPVVRQELAEIHAIINAMCELQGRKEPSHVEPHR
jgi:hypothetical protein